MNLDMKYLDLPLPEDIRQKRYYGDFDGERELIKQRMEAGLSFGMQQRMELELKMIAGLPREYPFCKAEAMRFMKEQIPDFTEEEWNSLELAGKIDWIYIHGEVKYFCRFAETLLKTVPQLKARALKREDHSEEEGHLNSTLEEMIEKGEIGYHIHLKTSLKIKEEAFKPGRVRVHLPLPIDCAQLYEGQLLDMEPAAKLITPEYYPQRSVFFEEHLKENQEFSVEYAFDNIVKYTNPDQELALASIQPVLEANPAEVLYSASGTASCNCGAKGQADGFSGKGSGCGSEGAADCGCNCADCEFGGGGVSSPSENLKYYERVTSADVSELAPHIRFTPYLRALAAEIIGDEENPCKKARKIYDYVTTKIDYSFVRGYLSIENQAEYTALLGRGDCGLQSLLFITLLRICKIPAGWQSGLYVTPFSVGCHDWARFYLAPYGWLYADCSFGGSAYRKMQEEGISKQEYEQARMRWNFYFGNLDPFRMPANSAYQTPLYPGKDHMRTDPYDNQSGEAEYEDRELDVFELERETKMIECTKITD